MRAAFAAVLEKIARHDNRVFLLTADLGFGLFDRFREAFPNRFINVGVAEANMIGVAAGLALSGKNVYCYSIVPFLIMRCLEQIRIDLCYQNLNVKLAGSGGGLSYGLEGVTHHAIEDLSIMRSLPNMTVVAPGDKLEAEAVTYESASHVGPLFLRLSKGQSLPVHEKMPKFKIGKGIVLKRGNCVSIIATGNMLATGKIVSDRLLRGGVSTTFVSMHTVKPLDADLLVECASQSRAVFTIEEHSIIGGLGSAVGEVLMESGYRGLFKRIALPDRYCTDVGEGEYLRGKNGLSPEAIFNRIMKECEGLLS